MSDTLVAPENELFPNRKRWTRKECEKLEKVGLLRERYELIDGEIISKMGQNPPHSVTLNRFILWLMKVFGAEFLRNQQDIIIPGRNGKSNAPQVVTLGPDETISPEGRLENLIHVRDLFPSLPTNSE